MTDAPNPLDELRALAEDLAIDQAGSVSHRVWRSRLGAILAKLGDARVLYGPRSASSLVGVVDLYTPSSAARLDADTPYLVVELKP